MDFNPLTQTEHIKTRYKEFLLTTFATTNNEFRKELDGLFSNGFVWSDSLISLSSRYTPGPKLEELAKLKIDARVISAFKLDRLYKHQYDAIKRIVNSENTVISTGTGSGKTESFLIPILDFCIKSKNAGIRGTKAIIVYPMKALANDQATRLQEYLERINKELNDEKIITFGVYDGDTPKDEQEIQTKRKDLLDKYTITEDERQPLVKKNKSEMITRKEIRENPPDILITNYVQLEYLLIRKQDQPLFATNCIKFIVFDELHSYRGAQGIDVAFLIRRLKQRVLKQNKDVVFIGTSATMSSKENEVARKKDIANFCTHLFGAPFDQENIIIAIPEKINFNMPTQFPRAGLVPIEHLEDVSDDVLQSLYIENIAADKKLPKERQLAELLLSNKFFEKLCDYLQRPTGTDTLVELVRNDKELEPFLRGKSKDYLFQIIWTYLKLGSKAEVRYTSESEPLIRVNVHNFFKTTSGVYRCLNPTCNKLFGKEIETCSCGSKAILPLATCRHCGENYYIVQASAELRDSVNKAPLKNVLRQLSHARAKEIAQTKEFFIERKTYNPYPNEAGLTNILLSPAVSVSDFAVCLSCGGLNSGTTEHCLNPNCRATNLVRLYNSVVKDGRPYQNKCPKCGYGGRGRNVAINHLIISPQNARHILFEQIFLALPEEKRKLLVFIDGVQECSKFAVGLEETHRAETVKNLIYNVLKRSQEDDEKRWLPLDELRNRIQTFYFDPWYASFSEPEIKEQVKFEVMKIILNEAAGRKSRSLRHLGLIARTFKGLESANAFSAEIQRDTAFHKFLLDKRVELEQARKVLLIILSDMANHNAFQSSIVSQVPLDFGNTYSGFLPAEHEKRIVESEQPYQGLNAKIYNFRYRKNLKALAEIISPELTESVLVQGLDYLKRHSIIQQTPIPSMGAKAKLVYAFVLNDSRVFLSSIIDVPPQTQSNYYAAYYLKQDPVRMVVQTDTAVSNPAERKKIEQDFRKTTDRCIDVIVATPTLELGVDIGDLLSVGLVKAPPSPAAYIQRVGRAGRKDRISFNNTFLHPNNIDEFYFERPNKLINGDIVPPAIDTANILLLKRHIFAVALQYMFTTSTWAKKYDETSCFKWNEHPDIRIAFNSALETEHDKILTQCQDFVQQIPEAASLFTRDKLSELLKQLPNEINLSFEEYSRRNAELIQRSRFISSQMEKEQDRFIIEKLTKKSTILSSQIGVHRQKHVLDLFKDINLLPRYAFSYSAISLYDGFEETSGREATASIVEYSPGMRIHLKKKRYESVGLDVSRIEKSTIYVCDKCKKFADISAFKTCSLCNSVASAVEADIVIPKRIYIKSIWYFSQTENRRPQYEQYVSPDYRSINKELTFEDINLKHFVEGKVYTVVKGININPQIDEIRKMKFCTECGKFEIGEENRRHRHPITQQFCHGNKFEEFLPAAVFNTSILVLDFEKTELRGEATFTTMKNAILNATNAVIGCEDGEVSGLVAGNKIFLFDNLEGGAGFTENILQHFKQIMARANELVNNPKDTCRNACLACLISYRRRRDIPLLDKKLIKIYLQNISNKIMREEITHAMKIVDGNFPKTDEDKPIIQTFKKELVGKQIYQIISQPETTDGADQLKAFLFSAKKEILITSLYVSDQSIPWKDGTLDSFENILVQIKSANPSIKITLIIRKPSKPSQDHVDVAKRLRNAGIDVKVYRRSISNLENRAGIVHEKMIAIDPDDLTRGIVIQTSANLSDEVYRNKDTWFFILEPQIIKENVRAFREVEAESSNLVD
jgi:ATP-dependent helicase YprA (DUF1998 family)/predicted RNA-binding Zn-ribbon protein involved in translation (DUF1610 family)